MKKKLFIALLGCSISSFSSHAGKRQEELWGASNQYNKARASSVEQGEKDFFSTLVTSQQQYYEEQANNIEYFCLLISASLSEDALKEFEEGDLSNFLNKKLNKYESRSNSTWDSNIEDLAQNHAKPTANNQKKELYHASTKLFYYEALMKLSEKLDMNLAKHGYQELLDRAIAEKLKEPLKEYLINRALGEYITELVTVRGIAQLPVEKLLDSLKPEESAGSYYSMFIEKNKKILENNLNEYYKKALLTIRQNAQIRELLKKEIDDNPYCKNHSEKGDNECGSCKWKAEGREADGKITREEQYTRFSNLVHSGRSNPLDTYVSSVKSSLRDTNLFEKSFAEDQANFKKFIQEHINKWQVRVDAFPKEDASPDK